MIILDQIFPGSGRITPVAGALVTCSYSRTAEYAADHHGIEILARAGYPKNVMVDTLTWLVQTEGASSGILASHPETQDRIDALKALYKRRATHWLTNHFMRETARRWRQTAASLRGLNRWTKVQ